MDLSLAGFTVLYLVYGLAFFSLGVVAFVLPRGDGSLPFARHFWLLGLFGLIHGAYEFLQAAGLHYPAARDPWLNATWQLLSYLPLLEFGRRALLASPSRLRLDALWLYPLIAVAVLLLVGMAEDPARGLANGGRYLVGLPGAVLSGLAFLLLLRGSLQRTADADDHASQYPALAVLALAFLGYALITPFPGTVDPALPEWLPTHADFLEASGLPVQLLRMFAALLAVIGMMTLTRSLGTQQGDDLLRVLDTIDGFVYRCRNNPNWDVINAEGALEELTGYSRERFFAERLSFNDLVHPEDRDRVWREVSEGLQRTGQYQIQWRLIGRNGGERWVFERGAGIFDDRGRLKYLQGHVIDADELVTTGETLRARTDELESFRSTLDLTLDAVFLFDVETLRFIYVNQGAVDQTGIPREELLELHPYDIKPDYPEPRFRQLIEPLRRGERDQFRFETSHRHRDGFEVPVEISLQLVAPRGETARYVAISHDITQRKRNEEALLQALSELEASRDEQTRLLELTRREQGRMAALLSAMSIGILFEDRNGQVEYVNPAFRRMWAIDSEVELVGRPSREVLEHSTHRFARPDHASRHVLHVLDTHEISERFEVDLYDGRILTQVSYPVHDTDERSIGRLWLYEDVTHERQTAQQLVYLAEHDALTGLYNRHHFQKRLEHVIHSERRRNGRFALLYFDLDEFKTINDTFGHRAGDTVLVRAAGEIAALVRSQDIFARLGGDEFAILVDRESEQEPIELAERVGRAISAIPFRFRGQNYRLTASIGIAHFPEHGDNVEDLVAHADTAMYQAKDLGKNTWAVFDRSRNTAEHMLERMSWSQRIGTALEQGHFELHYQGIYAVGDGHLHHMEALVRMRDPASPEEIAMPGQFIPIAEKTGQILDIDRWVIRESIRRLAGDPAIPGIAINISGRSFDEPGLPQYIAHQLEQQGVEPRRLIIELTETAAVSEMQDAQRFIEALQHTGCTVCLDDFGSGFSTFAYLKYLGVQILKIDGMFVRDLPNNRDNQAFIRAMVDVARGLDKQTVAECVEDGPTLEMLAELGVDMAQGYHLHRPSPELPTART
ncbi:EAL domain-containing protein [Thioalkalivibrio sp. ALE16]|uniref:sensor domain-containing protein n=1 Tax=Thioalkalivibrio sp. ALE16 TaxID=1158172 RepID=UPI00036399AD|nr:EAL domain-containing protein [Thioalkalivibrio sp. ALE16]